VIDAEPLITVIIPTFRRPKLLRRAILSVLNQTFTAFQVCVYDDASNDNTQKVVTELAETDSRIKYYCHEQNIGVVANFNYGLKEVNTPFFSFLSDDDLLLPHFFEVAMQALSSNADVMFYAGLTIQVEDEKIIGISKNNGRFGYLSPPDSLLDILDHQLMWNSIVFRSKVVDCVGLLDTDVGGPADIDFEFRVAAHHPVIISNEPSAIYVLHTQNFYARSADYRLSVSGFKLIINKMMPDESLSFDTRIHIKNRLNALLANALIALAERASLKGDFDQVSAIAKILTRFCNKKAKALLLVYNFSAIAKILTRFCNKKAKALLLVGRLKLKESSEPAFLVVSWIERWLWFIFPLTIINKLKLKQLQRKYGEYLRYLDT
jgi:glycosyltransferase involved in cell wall biosynthesis